DGMLGSSVNVDSSVAERIESSSEPLLAAGGIFLALLFLHWLFKEPKDYGLRGEEYLHKKGVWFYAVVSILLTLLIWYSIPVNAVIAFGAALGSSLFFITHGFRQNAEER